MVQIAINNGSLVSSLHPQTANAYSLTRLARSASSAGVSASVGGVTVRNDRVDVSLAGRFTSQVTALRTAASNASAGASLLQTAHTALAQIESKLQRLEQIATQVTKSDLSTRERATLDVEFQSLKSAIDTIASTTEFNGTNLLQGATPAASVPPPAEPPAEEPAEEPAEPPAEGPPGLGGGGASLGGVPVDGTPVDSDSGNGSGSSGSGSGSSSGSSGGSGTSSPDPLEITFKVGAGSSSADSITISIAASSVSDLSSDLESGNVTNGAGATAALTAVKAAQDALGERQASVSGGLERLQSASLGAIGAAGIIEVASENLRAPEITIDISRIVADQASDQGGLFLADSATELLQGVLLQLQGPDPASTAADDSSRQSSTDTGSTDSTSKSGSASTSESSDTSEA